MTPESTTPTTDSSSSDSRKSALSAAEESKTFVNGIQNALQQHQQQQEEDEDRSIPMGLYWDEWSRCVGSGYQMDSLYRNGKIDGCGKQWKDLKLAAEARLLQWRNPEKAQQLIASTYYTKRTTISPTAGAIWELKEQPGWN